ncbi:MAG: acyl-CoA dehydrogenase family protein [Rhodoferax sp.]|jgi:alkylation response protein AidB-like acyl-CoA dehydrogenase|nr:acyl-CoA dehydrogenase family protein [Rhodoferax sp.]
MQFSLNSEQQMLVDSVDRFVREQHRFDQWHPDAQAGLAFKESNWQQMADMGWLGLAISPAHGGMGASPVETMLLMDGFGRGLVREPYVSSCVLAARLLSDAAHPQGPALLEGIATGRTRVAVALGEPQARFRLQHQHTSARKTGGMYVLDGEKSWVPDGSSAHWLLVPARTSGAVDDRHGISLFLVPIDAPGLRMEHYRGADHQHASRLVLCGLELSAQALVGSEGEGLPLLECAVDHAIAARLAEACGAMDAVTAMTIEYSKTRKQFGVAIGTFQALQHRMVDMAIACEEARAILNHATDGLALPVAARRRAVSAAKARIGQCALFVGHQAVQVHGGIGTSDELVVSHYLKRLSAIELAFGNSDYHLTQVADAMVSVAPGVPEHRLPQEEVVA